MLNLCCRMHQVPEFVLPRSPRNFKLNLGGTGVTLAPPIKAQIPGPVPIICAVECTKSQNLCCPAKPLKFKSKIPEFIKDTYVGQGRPAPPMTAQIPGPVPIICAEFVLSNAPRPRICAATQPEKLKIEFGWCGRHVSTTHNSTNSRTFSNNLC